MNGFTSVIKAFLSILASLCIMISMIGQGEVKNNYYPDISTLTYGGTDALQRGQGVTTDGNYYYFSSNYGLLKTELDGVTQVNSNIIGIPTQLLKLGCKHIGGISYANGKIFAPIEDSKVFENLYIAVFDAQTLELIKYKAVPLEYHENGIPWVVADTENGVLYSARCDNIEQLNIFDMETLEFIGTKPVNTPIDNIQGGEVYSGILYLSVSHADQAIYAVELSSGRVTKAISRNLIEGSEGEGMTILPGDDGAFFRVLDIADVRTAVHLRTYAFNPEDINF